MKWIRPYLAVGPIIGDRYWATTWSALRKNKVTAIIDLNDSEPERLEAEFLGFKYHGLPINDPPFDSQELLDAFPVVCNWIDEERSGGGKVYLHCTGGVERSPTCAAAYLIFDEGLSTNQAIGQVAGKNKKDWVRRTYVGVFFDGLEEWNNVARKFQT